ncbi:MAG: phosphatidate cytidylyltransferase [Saprospiraceae bacterium]|nr:phosphatidate cytidylyltransferase [Saprospiraceae bacterium]
MKQRVISAIIFVIAMLGGVFGGAKAFYLLFSVIVAGSLWEFSGLLFSREKNHLLFRRITATLLGSLPFLIFGSKIFQLFSPLPGNSQFQPYLFVADLSDNLSPILISMTLILLSVFVLLIIELFLLSEQPFSNIGNYLLGVAYLGIPFSLLISISYWHGNYAPLRVFGLLFLTWTNDTMAYLIGSKIGKTPFFARISPKKTWEGTIGGVVCTFIVAYFFSIWILDFELSEWMLQAAIIAVFGTLGDLVESMLKRSIHVKDSGSILPGHGGFLDRFDSFIFALPFVWLALMIFEG